MSNSPITPLNRTQSLGATPGLEEQHPPFLFPAASSGVTAQARNARVHGFNQQFSVKYFSPCDNGRSCQQSTVLYDYVIDTPVHEVEQVMLHAVFPACIKSLCETESPEVKRNVFGFLNNLALNLAGTEYSDPLTYFTCLARLIPHMNNVDIAQETLDFFLAAPLANEVLRISDYQSHFIKFAEKLENIKMPQTFLLAIIAHMTQFVAQPKNNSFAYHNNPQFYTALSTLLTLVENSNTDVFKKANGLFCIPEEAEIPFAIYEAIESCQGQLNYDTATLPLE